MRTDQSLIIKNATIIDGIGEQPYIGSVFINNKRIEKINSEKINIPVDKVIDASGMFLLPGIIDCHVHVMMNQYNLMDHINTPFSLNFYNSIHNLETLLLTGITSARDAGGADLGVKRALENKLLKGPKLKISITPLSITGGHLDAWMPSGIKLHLLNPPYPGNPEGICDGLPEVRKKVRQILRAGADVIKTCSTGGVLSPTDHPEFTQFSMEELKIMVAEGAMRKGIKVMAHAQGLEGIKNAIKAGVHSIEHGVMLDNEAIDLMLENNVFLVPTLLAINSVIHGDYSEKTKNKAKAIFETHQESIAKAYKSGVKIAMGTDSGVMEHGRNLEELELMCNVGLSPMESIMSATSIASQCLEINKETGNIEEGKIADLLLVKENPLTNISSLANKDNIKVILQEGEEIKNTIQYG
ncbi:metal-dependent hydrolase family protein [Tenacibaculum xiamenense]|uniref:metal-dependent hydrolase family protein n=1 Tax=Tenacibaculum xiamenense TaxID=1261553 RepID=UPI003893DA12